MRTEAKQPNSLHIAEEQAVGDDNDLPGGTSSCAATKSYQAHEVTALKRRNHTLLKMVMGMALGGYGFDARASRSRIPREIADDLLRAGIPVDQDTIRKVLREAAEILQPG